jgi:hypothetical protein
LETAHSTNKVVLVDAGIDGTIPNCATPNLVCAAIPLNDQKIPVRQTPALQLFQRQLEAFNFLQTQSISLYVRNPQIWKVTAVRLNHMRRAEDQVLARLAGRFCLVPT